MLKKTVTELSIHFGIGATKNFPVEIDASDFYLSSGFPARISGRFLKATLEQLLRFETRRGPNVGLRGARYDFAEIERNGKFILDRHVG